MGDRAHSLDAAAAEGSPACIAENFPGNYHLWRGYRTYAVKAGRDRGYPPLLLLHGFGASTDHWRKTIADLSQDFEVWALDLLGFGRSQKPAIAYSGELWRDQVADFTREVIGRPAILAGNSLGGYVCLCVAADASDWVRGTILLNSAGPFTDTNPLGSKPVSPLQTALRSGARALLKQRWATWLLFQTIRRKSAIRNTLLQVYRTKSAVTDRLVEEIYRPSCDAGALDVFASVFSTPQGRTVDRLLADMSCPLLTIWGTADPWMDARARGSKFREHYPHLQELYLDSGHCPHDDTPELVNPAIRAWAMGIS